MFFHAEGVQEFLELFLDTAFFASENVLDRLLRERGSALDDTPDAVTYVSISDRMERILYHHRYQTTSIRQVKNISEVCPMDWIYGQYALVLYDLGDISNALDAATEAVKWNPASAKCKVILAMLYAAAGRWEDSLKETVSAMKYAYLSIDLVHCFRSLRDYFIYKNLYKEAVYCSFLRARFSSSHDVLCEILNDMMMVAKGVDFDYKSISDEDMAETCKKYGFKEYRWRP